MAKAYVYLVHNVASRDTRYAVASQWPVTRLGGPAHAQEIYAVVAEADGPTYQDALRTLRTDHDVQIIVNHGLLHGGTFA